MTQQPHNSGKNNPMGSTTKPDEAVERVKDFSDAYAAMFADDNVIAELRGRRSLPLRFDDIRTILAEIEDFRSEADISASVTEAKDAEIERLRADCERFRAEADIANAQVKAWNDAVYVEGMPLRAIPDTDYGDKVSPIPHVGPKKVTDLLSERGRLRKSLLEMITAIQDGQIDSPELGSGDVPVHRWHEEWLHHAEQALKGGA